MAPARRTGPLIDEESALLGGNSRSNKSPKRTRADKGVICNRYFILILLVAMVLLSVRYQQQINSLELQIQESQQSIKDIHTTLAVHEEVIERFNSSVTNRDVIAQLTALQNSLNVTSVYLQDQLVRVQTEVAKQLDNTVKELSETVTKAEQEISDEVEKVKKDVEHYVITTQDQFSMENSFMVYQLAGTFTLLSCLISMWHMTAHLRKMEQPMVQRKILAILWMSPIYAVTSWFSLVFPPAEGYLAIIKDGYEAYIIYQFLSFCIAVIGRGDRDAVVDVLARHADHLTPPFRLLGCFEFCGWCMPEPYPDNRALAHDILLQCQGFAMQFVLFRPLTTTAMVVLKNMNYFGAGDGPTDYRAPQFYITIVQNLSIFVAFTGLLKFYHAVDKELAWCRPLAKFLCIKGVVFMTFWQGLAISVLAQTTDVAGNDKEEWAMSAQNFLICLEMLLFSIAHFYCFPTEEWQEGYRIKHQGGQFGDTIALGDFFQDVKLILTSRGAELKPKRRRKKSAVFGTSSKSLMDIDNPSVSVTAKEMLAKAASKSTLSPGSSVEKMEREEAQFVDIEQADMMVPLYDSTSGGNEDDNDDDSEYETDDDDSDGSSEEDLNDDQQFVKRALKRSLGIAGNDPDIIEATKRLLENNLLSPDFFNGSDDELPASLYGAFDSSSGHGKKDSSDDDESSEDDDEDDDDDESGHDEEAANKQLPQSEKASEHVLMNDCSDDEVETWEDDKGKQEPTPEPAVTQKPSPEPVEKQDQTAKPDGKQDQTANIEGKQEPTSNPVAKEEPPSKPAPQQEPPSQPAPQQDSSEPDEKPSEKQDSAARPSVKQGQQIRTGIPVGEQARRSSTAIPVGEQAGKSLTAIPAVKQARSSDPVKGKPLALPSDVWPEREIISSAMSSINACMAPIDEDFQAVHVSKSDGALQRATNSTPTKSPQRKGEPLQKKNTTPGRAYQQKGLEFLTPERMGSEDLRPSIFTTISLLDKKREEEESEEEES